MAELSTKVKVLLFTLIAGNLLFLVQGFSNAGSYYYFGEEYKAGSLFSPNKVSYDLDSLSYGDIGFGDALLYSASQPVIEKINQELSDLRHQKILGMITGLGLAVGSVYLLIKDNEFIDYLTAKFNK